MTGPDPRRVRNLEDLAAELALLLTMAARGTGRPKVSLAELAKRLGLPPSSKSSMHSYVTGRTLAPAEVLDAMVIALGAAPVEQREWSEAWFRVAANRQRFRRRTRHRLPSDTVSSVPATEFVGRTWVFDQIATWLASTASILLITGEPGAGKSALIGNLVSITGGESPPRGVVGPEFLSATHFCRQQAAESVDATTVIRLLATQLCRTVPGFVDALRHGSPQPDTVIDDDELAAILRTEWTPRQAYDKYIRQPLRLLAAGPNPPTAVVVAVDGLDEAVEGGAGLQLVSTLARESALVTPGLRLLLTSRPGRAIRHLDAASRFDLIDDEPEVGEDVRDYLERRLHARSVPSAGVLARRISTKGRGNFLYARFVVDDLLARPGPVTLAGVRLPDGLAGLYREFLNREIALVEPEWRRRHRPLLGFLAEARGDGLTAAQLTQLTGLPRSAVEDSILLCAPYLRHSQESGAHRLFHQSFRDYLRADGEHHVYPAEVNGHLVRVLDQALAQDVAHPLRAYAGRHLLRHLADPTEPGTAKGAMLDRALRHVPFLSAKAAADGIDTLITEAEQAARVCGAPAGSAAELLATLKHQAYNLRTWQPDRHPELLVQQLHYEAAKSGFDDAFAVLEAHATRHQARWLRVTWTSATSHASAPAHLTGHGDTISTAAVSPDGRYVITGSYDHTVRIWDHDGTVRRVLRHPGPVQSVLALPTGEHLASTCDDHLVYVWSLTADGQDHQLEHADVVGPVAVTPDGRLVSGCHDGITHVWRPDRSAVMNTFVHDDRVNAIDILADGRHAVTGSEDHTAYVWDLDSGALLMHFDHSEPVRLVSHTPDGQLLATLSGDARLTGWHVPTGTKRFQLEAPDAVRQLSVVDERHLLAACGRQVLRWDLRHAARPPVPIAVHDDVISSFAVWGKLLLTAGRDNTARIWTSGDPRPQHDLRHDDWVTTIIPARAGQVLTASDDRSACTWRIGDGTLVRRLSGNADSVRTVDISANGDIVVAGSDDHTVRVWDSRSGKLQHTLRHRDRVRAVAVTADGQSVISGSDDGTACQWELGSGAIQHKLPHDGPVRGLAVDPAGTRVVTGSDDHLVRVWHSETGRLERVLHGHHDVVRAVAVTPDAERIVTGSRDGTAIIWTPTRATPLHVLPHQQWVRGVAITHDQRYVLTTSTDGLVRMWDLAQGRLITELAGHQKAVKDVYLSRNSHLAVTASNDRTVGVWDLRRHRQSHRLLHESGVRSVRITPDGTHAISTSDDRTARIWDLTTGTELHRISAAHRIACCAIDPTDNTRVALGTSSGEVLLIARAGPRQSRATVV